MDSGKSTLAVDRVNCLDTARTAVSSMGNKRAAAMLSRT